VNIWVPHTHIRHATWKALEPYKGVSWMPLDEDAGYPKFLKDRWDAGRDFINVEHDVVFHRGALEELWACPHPWCAFSYGEMFTECTTTLGCVCFSAEFIQSTAGVWDAMLANAIDRYRNPTGLDIRGNPKWKLCDCWLTAWARHVIAPGSIEVHQHFPAVQNLRAKPPLKPPPN
jgi:hypothetical protein